LTLTLMRPLMHHRRAQLHQSSHHRRVSGRIIGRIIGRVNVNDASLMRH
jgi:hypothetical protein